jgi:hypothetical protein
VTGRELHWMQLQGTTGQTNIVLYPWDGRGFITATPSPISLENAAWNPVGNTLTKTGAFAGYTFAAGERMEITGGTGITTGYVQIASKTSDNVIVLSTSIGVSGASDVSGRIGGVFGGQPNVIGRRTYLVHGWSIVIPPTITTDLNIYDADGNSISLSIVPTGLTAGFWAPLPRFSTYTGIVPTVPAGLKHTDDGGGIPILDRFSAQKDETAGSFNILFSIDIG